MNYSELLHDWLDGSLPSEHEEALFIALGKDTALRSEMQDLMRLRAAVQNDTAAFTPSPSDTTAIFGKLGFAVPVGMPSVAASSVAAPSVAASSVAATGIAANAGLRAAVVGSSGKTVLKRLVGGIGSVVASACVASLITILLLDWRNGTLFGGNRESVGGNTFQNQAFTPPPDPNAPFFNANPPLRNGFVFDTLRGAVSQVSFQAAPQVVVREIIREIVRYVAPTDLFSNPQHYSISNQYAQQSGSNSASNLDVRTLAQEPSTPPKSEQTNNRESAPHLAPQALTPQAIASQTPVPQAIAPSTNTENPSVEAILQRFRLGVRGFVTMSLPASSLKPSAADFLNNAAISLYYALSPNHAIGIEAGQEAFYQQYITTENQDTYTIAQYPTQVWGGVSYRYTLLPEQAFTPFAGATVGLAGYGVMGRTQLGCTYAPDGGITQFILGVEASALFYGHQGANYFSPKVGVTYGVAVRL